MSVEPRRAASVLIWKIAMNATNKPSLPDNAFTRALRVHTPARIVPVHGPLAVKVFPVAFSRIEQFTMEVKTFMNVLLTKIEYDDVAKRARWDKLKEALPAILPTLMNDCSRLIASSCVGVQLKEGKQEGSTNVEDYEDLDKLNDLGDLPHYIIPQILWMWFDTSWTEERLHPWFEALENLVHRFTGEKIQMSAIFSNSSSAMATGLKMFSVPKDLRGRTPATPSPSSTNGSDDATSSTPAGEPKK